MIDPNEYQALQETNQENREVVEVENLGELDGKRFEAAPGDVKGDVGNSLDQSFPAPAERD